MVLSWILQTTQLLVTILFMMNMIQRLGVDLAKAKCLLGTTRPTAVNLVWALDKVVNILISIVVISFKKGERVVVISFIKVSESEDMEEAAAAIHRDDVQLCRRLGQVFHDCDHFDSAGNHE